MRRLRLSKGLWSSWGRAGRTAPSTSAACLREPRAGCAHGLPGDTAPRPLAARGAWGRGAGLGTELTWAIPRWCLGGMGGRGWVTVRGPTPPGRSEMHCVKGLPPAAAPSRPCGLSFHSHREGQYLSSLRPLRPWASVSFFSSWNLFMRLFLCVSCLLRKHRHVVQSLGLLRAYDPDDLRPRLAPEQTQALEA